MDHSSNIETICISQAVLVEGNSDHPIERFQTDKVRRREWFLCVRGENQARCVVEQQGPFWGIVTLVEPGGGSVRDVLGIEHPRYAKPPDFWSVDGLAAYWKRWLPQLVERLMVVNENAEQLRDCYRDLWEEHDERSRKYFSAEHEFGQVRGELRNRLRDGEITQAHYNEELTRFRNIPRLSLPRAKLLRNFEEIVLQKVGFIPSSFLLSSLVSSFERT